jgi:hypothetical protein
VGANVPACGAFTVMRPKACQFAEMVLLALDYGDLIRPSFRLLPSRGWGQCTNFMDEYLIVYGPKHESEKSIFDT